MSDTVIKVENLGKKYIIGHQDKGIYRTFREQMVYGLLTVLFKTKQMFSGRQIIEGDKIEELWALKDVNFEVKQGETIGIIGRNGAGKSTLLKILSRITEPTTGKVAIKGRVASLLEVGTGFHPELTGRENIFLNGAILGMSQTEIKRKFDEIVDFSGVEKFLDTPVKRFSSGMYVRLAFSVAAHLEPEILVVDEVLAVGDAEFQKKCLGKMQDVSYNEGRTVLFVSHNLPSIKNLCKKGIYLKDGELKQIGNIEEVILGYINNIEFVKSEARGFRVLKDQDKANYFSGWGIKADDKRIYSAVTNSEVVFEFDFITQKELNNVEIGFVVRNISGVIIFGFNNRMADNSYLDLQKGEYCFSISVELPLHSGNYEVDIILVSNGEVIDHWVSPTLFEVVDVYQNPLPHQWRGILNKPFHFLYEKVD